MYKLFSEFSHKGYIAFYFYASGSNDLELFAFVLSVHLSVLSTLTSVLTFELNYM